MRKNSVKKMRLTQTVSTGGCASKLNPSLLREAVKSLKAPDDPRLLVGYKNADDAGVYLLSKNLALVQTVDFFAPIIDDPLWYGRIAAANALSDVYAMGGKPLTALNVFAYCESLGPTVLKNILKGGLEKMIEAGCTLVGGHSVSDREMKYGLAVTGLINPRRIFSNDKLVSGQTLLLTKKLGTGIVASAAKYQKCPPKLLRQAVKQMATLNDRASFAMLKTRATGCTDITGFGFLGHLSEMTRASQKKVRIFADAVPYFDEIQSLIAQEFLTGGDKLNREYAGKVTFRRGLAPWLQSVMFDPQTSGGLLISLPAEDVPRFQKIFSRRGEKSWVVGEVLGKSAGGEITVES